MLVPSLPSGEMQTATLYTLLMQTATDHTMCTLNADGHTVYTVNADTTLCTLASSVLSLHVSP